MLHRSVILKQHKKRQQWGKTTKTTRPSRIYEHGASGTTLNYWIMIHGDTVGIQPLASVSKDGNMWWNVRNAAIQSTPSLVPVRRRCETTTDVRDDVGLDNARMTKPIARIANFLVSRLCARMHQPNPATPRLLPWFSYSFVLERTNPQWR